MAYVAATKTGDVAPGKMKAVEAGGKKLLLANVDGAFYAMQKNCPHLGFNLCRGKLNGTVVTCALHGAGFDLKDGSAVNPANLIIFKKLTKNAVTYPVKVEGDQVMIDV
ncbi:MAG: Rieske 2Fe-2S domain-containing protein [Caulobacterales bacterium]